MNTRAILDGYIEESELAAQEGVTQKTWQRRRYRREAPPHVILGRKIFYRVDAVRDWLAEREQDFSKNRKR